MKKVFLTLLLLLVTSGFVFVYAQEYPIFSDLSPDHWAYDEIIYLANRGVITGYPDGTFRPEESVTREQFASLVVGVGVFGRTEETDEIFIDVPINHWSNRAITAAVRHGIVIPKEHGDYFQRQLPITREDAAIWIVRALDIGGIVSQMDTDDPEQIARARIVAITIAAGIGLIADIDDDLHEPTTRASAAVFLKRMLENFMHEVTILGDGISERTFPVSHGHLLYGYLPSPERDGYEFLGWFLDDEYRITQHTLIERDMVLFANWHKIYSYITISGDGIYNLTITARNGDLLALYLPVPRRSGYMFDVWLLNGETMLSDYEIVESDMFFVASWQRIPVNPFIPIGFFMLSLLLFAFGVLAPNRIFKTKSSTAFCVIMSVFFNFIFTLFCWTLYRELLVPFGLQAIEPSRDPIGGLAFHVVIQQAGSWIGLLVPIVFTLLLATILPMLFFSPGGRIGKEIQYRIHFAVTFVGILFPLLIWIVYGASLVMLWFVLLSLFVFTGNFFFSAFLLKQGDGRNCGDFFFI